MTTKFKFPTYAGFTRWLSRQPKNERVGTAQEECKCPVARYTRTLNPTAKRVAVGFGDITITDRKGVKHTRSNPGWLSKFVTLVDEGPTRSVTAQRALGYARYARR